MPITTIDLLFRQTAEDHERRVRDAGRRIRLEGGRPLRPGLRRTTTLAARAVSVVRPHARRSAATPGAAPTPCEPALPAGPRLERLR